MLRAHDAVRTSLALLIAAGSLAACADEQGAPDAIQPSSIVVASRPPPPVSGGTLLVAADGVTAIAADPDRDRVWLADLPSRKLVAEIALDPLDEPGRVAEGPPGRVHVALRRGGAVATIDLATRQIVARTPVCPAPRGMAYVAADDALHVACAGGELVTISATTGAEQRRLRLATDLRDVAIDGDRLLVTRFRSGDVLVVNDLGDVDETLALSSLQGFDAAVAWRMVPLAAGGAAIVHQRGSGHTISTSPGGYGQPDGCGESIVQTTVSFVDRALGGVVLPGHSIGASALPVDVAFSPDGTRFAIVAAGSNTLSELWTSDYQSEVQDVGPCSSTLAVAVAQGQPTAVAYAGGDLLIQTREPSSLFLRDGGAIALPGESVFDTGHEMFHRPPSPALALACASCHPEGRDDGRVWAFDVTGPRRTQTTAGNVLATAPLHWDGDLDGLDSLMDEVFTRRMSGQAPSPRRVRAFGTWIDTIPRLPASPVVDEAAAARGQALFEDAAVGCATCHAGPRLTNNATVDVGTGRVFQVPTLRDVASRAPYMHDGCAPTLKARFTDALCGGGDAHGVTSGLSSAQTDDLVAYLETL